MQTNIPKPPEQGNQQDTTDQDYEIGDVVVYADGINIESLETIEAYQPDDHYWLEGGQLVHASHIRLATTAELKARRRLSETELSMAEVS